MLAIQIFAMSVNILAVVASIVMLIRLYKNIPNPKTQAIFGTILLVQILVQTLAIYTYQFNLILRIQNAIWLCLLASCFGQIILNAYIIQIFSALDPRMTNTRIKWFYGTVLGIFTFCSLPLVVFFIFDELVISIGRISNYFGMVVAVSTILIDEIQAVYLTFLVFQKGRKLKAFEALVMTIVYLIIQILVDWSAATAQTINLIIPEVQETLTLRLNLQQIAVGLGSIHFAISVHVFIQFKLLFLAGFATSKKVCPVKPKSGFAKRPLESDELEDSPEAEKKLTTTRSLKKVEFNLPLST